MGRPVPTSEVMVGKVAAVAVLAPAMQLVLVATVVLLGKVAFQMPGMWPSTYLLGSLLIIVATTVALNRADTRT